MYGWFIWLYSRNYHNIVKQLYSNKNWFKKEREREREESNKVAQAGLWAGARALPVKQISLEQRETGLWMHLRPASGCIWDLMGGRTWASKSLEGGSSTDFPVPQEEVERRNGYGNTGGDLQAPDLRVAQCVATFSVGHVDTHKTGGSSRGKEWADDAHEDEGTWQQMVAYMEPPQNRWEHRHPRGCQKQGTSVLMDHLEPRPPQWKTAGTGDNQGHPAPRPSDLSSPQQGHSKDTNPHTAEKILNRLKIH